MPPAASTKGSVAGNLKSDDKIIPATPAFDPDNADTYNYVSEVTATDSLGNKHAIKVYYVHTAEGEWKAHAQDSTALVLLADGASRRLSLAPTASLPRR